MYLIVSKKMKKGKKEDGHQEEIVLAMVERKSEWEGNQKAAQVAEECILLALRLTLTLARSTATNCAVKNNSKIITLHSVFTDELIILDSIRVDDEATPHCFLASPTRINSSGARS